MPMMLTHDTSIDYDVQGDGPFLLLINGLGFGRWAWFKQTPALSRHFRTITFDIRGEHSLSRGVADLCAEAVALLDHLGVEKAHVLGTSLGGFVAQKLALERPDLVDHLMLVCTSYGAREPQPMSFQALGKMLGGGSLSPESGAPGFRGGNLRLLPCPIPRGVRPDPALAPRRLVVPLRLLPADDGRHQVRRGVRREEHRLPNAGDPRHRGPLRARRQRRRPCRSHPGGHTTRHR